MPLPISSTNAWILAAGLALIVVNVVASSRLAPRIATLFERILRPHTPRH